MPLTERQRAILDFERAWWSEPGTKAEAIRRRFGLSPGRYYQVLVGLTAMPEAAAYDPLVVRRLRKLQSARRRARIEGPVPRPGGRPGPSGSLSGRTGPSAGQPPGR